MRYTQEPGREHPVTAWIGIVAIAAAIAGIVWAYVQLNGLHELNDAIGIAPAAGATEVQLASSEGIASVCAAVASSRWATGFSQ